MVRVCVMAELECRYDGNDGTRDVRAGYEIGHITYRDPAKAQSAVDRGQCLPHRVTPRERADGGLRGFDATKLEYEPDDRDLEHREEEQHSWPNIHPDDVPVALALPLAVPLDIGQADHFQHRQAQQGHEEARKQDLPRDGRCPLPPALR